MLCNVPNLRYHDNENIEPPVNLPRKRHFQNIISTFSKGASLLLALVDQLWIIINLYELLRCTFVIVTNIWNQVLSFVFSIGRLDMDNLEFVLIVNMHLC